MDKMTDNLASVVVSIFDAGSGSCEVPGVRCNSMDVYVKRKALADRLMYLTDFSKAIRIYRNMDPDPDIISFN